MPPTAEGRTTHVHTVRNGQATIRSSITGDNVPPCIQSGMNTLAKIA